MLGSSLPANSIVVLFRNNHFATLYKHVIPQESLVDKFSKMMTGVEESRKKIPGEYELLQLVTDQGFVSDRGIVWETLSNTEGDSTFLNGRFSMYKTGVIEDAQTDQLLTQLAAEDSAARQEINAQIPSGDQEAAVPVPPAIVPNELASDGTPDGDFALALALQQQEEATQDEDDQPERGEMKRKLSDKCLIA